MTEEEALRKALDRERARRRKAEMLLEEKSRELFASFEELEMAHDALKANQKQLVKSEKMASLGIMSAGVAHEINNPTGFVLSNIRSLQDSMPDLSNTIQMCRSFVKQAASEAALAEAARKIELDIEAAGIDFILEDLPDLLEESNDGLVRIRDIVTGLKTFANTDDVQRGSVDLNKVVRSALIMVRGNLPETIELIESYADLPAFDGNEAGLSQVLLNILGNAGDAIVDSGSESGRIEIQTSFQGTEIRVRVADTGCGISPENIEKLFTPFFTTKDVGKGTGLGLSASIGVVEDHGGRIDVSSEIGKGTHFTIVLPCSDSMISQSGS